MCRGVATIAAVIIKGTGQARPSARPASGVGVAHEPIAAGLTAGIAAVVRVVAGDATADVHLAGE